MTGTTASDDEVDANESSLQSRTRRARTTRSRSKSAFHMNSVVEGNEDEAQAGRMEGADGSVEVSGSAEVDTSGGPDMDGIDEEDDEDEYEEEEEDADDDVESMLDQD